MTQAKKINYDRRVFRPVRSSDSGEAGSETLFHYSQHDDVVWATYSGGSIQRGQLLAIAAPNGDLEMRYHHVNTSGDLMTGICRSQPELLEDGRLRLHEEWRWTSGDLSSGTSTLEEILPSQYGRGD